MTGAIPKYGEQFALEHLDEYDPELASRRYVLKAGRSWHIRSDKTSKCWMIFHDGRLVTFTGSLTGAMKRLLDGIDQGYYQVSQP